MYLLDKVQDLKFLKFNRILIFKLLINHYVLDKLFLNYNNMILVKYKLNMLLLLFAVNNILYFIEFKNFDLTNYYMFLFNKE